MEGRLFGLSMWCGVYGLMVRGLLRSKNISEKTWTTMVIDSLFWATFMAMLGMLFASYTDHIDETSSYSLGFAFVGLIVGAVIGSLKAKNLEKREAMIRDNLEWADTGFSAILLASVVMFFVVQAFKIPSGSMRMTFVEGDHLFVNKFIYGVPVPFTDKKIHPFRPYTPGDVVIFRFPSDDKNSPHYGKDFIKRTIALAGQTVQIINKQVYVDGVPREEPFKQHVDPLVYAGTLDFPQVVYQTKWEKGEFAQLMGNEIRDNFGPVVVPKDHIFVMGDNRDRSYDARFWGPLPVKEIKGKAWVLYWPFSRFKVVK